MYMYVLLSCKRLTVDNPPWSNVGLRSLNHQPSQVPVMYLSLDDRLCVCICVKVV